MALNFTTTITLATGIEIANAYGRVAVADQPAGNVLNTLVDVYTSEEAFTNKLQPLQVPFKVTMDQPYDRTVDGTDILDIAHDALIASLADQGYTATKSL